MDRESIGYKLRRKAQVMCHHIFSDKFMSKFYYKVLLHEKLNLDNPVTFNEKLQWLKLNYLPKNDLVIQCADKYRVREHIEKCGYGKYLVPLINHWNNAKDINWDELPNKFVLKCNHGCAYNIVVNDKNKLDKEATVKKLNSWLKEDFGAFNIELHYSKIKNRVITCEEFLGDCITDYKFFCFNGEPKFIYVSNDLIHDRDAQIGFYNLDGSEMELKRDDYKPLGNIKFPSYFNEMLNMAKDLSKDFPFVRVDFFIANDTYYFAELTFTPSACMMPFNPRYIDKEWGDMLDISNLIK